MTIAEVSKMFDLTADTLRYYERIGLIPPVKRNKSGIRDYDDHDCYWIKFVKCMRGAGLPVEVLIEYMNLWSQGESTAEVRRELLVEQRDILKKRMEDMQTTLNRLDEKIDRYDTVVIPQALKNRDNHAK